MNRGTKVLHIVGWVFFAIALIILIGWQRLPALLSQHISKTLEVPVTVEDVYADSEKIIIDGLVVYNLPESNLSFAFKAHRISIFTPLLNYFREEVIINQIKIEEVYLGLEFDSISGEEGNWTRLIGNLRSTSEEEGHTVLIHEIVLKDIATQLNYKDQGSSVIDLPQIPELIFTDVSSHGGISSHQIMESILGKMLIEVFTRENLKNMIANIVTLPFKPIKYILFPFFGLFGGKKKEKAPPPEVQITPAEEEVQLEEQMPEDEDLEKAESF